jgi:hypothetical protein
VWVGGWVGVGVGVGVRVGVSESSLHPHHSPPSSTHTPTPTHPQENILQKSKVYSRGIPLTYQMGLICDDCASVVVHLNSGIYTELNRQQRAVEPILYCCSLGYTLAGQASR